MSDDKILIIYRENNFYKDITEFISNFTDINKYKISLHNFTNELLDDTIFNTVVNYDVSESKSSVADIIKFFYNDNLNNYCLVFDSCIKYNGEIIIDELLGGEDIFIKITGSICDVVFILGKTINPECANIIFNYNYNSNESEILLQGSIDSAYLINLDDDHRLHTYLLKYALNIKIDSEKLNSFSLINEEEYYRSFLSVLISSPSPSSIKRLSRLLYNNSSSHDILYLLLNHIDENPEFILGEEMYNNILDTIKDLQEDGDNILGILDFKKDYNNRDTLEFVIKHSLNKKFIDIYSIPKWCITDHYKSITEYYPTLTTGEIIKINAPFKIDNNITLLSKNIFGLEDNILNLQSDKIILNENEFQFDNKNGISVLYSEDTLYLYTQMSPLMIYSITDENGLEVIEDGIFNYDIPGYELIGNVIKYMNLNICLMQVDNKSYRLLLLDSHTLDCIEKSYNFNISEGQAIGLYVENGVLYILGEASEKEEKYLYKQAVCTDILFLELTTMFNLRSYIELNISDKNNILLDIPDWNYDTFVYENFIFTKDSEYDIKASYDPDAKILRIDDKIKYTNEFIYLPDNTADNPDKTHELCFDMTAKETLLYEKSKEFNISISEDCKNAKYYIIDQMKFESLTSAELSRIINNNTLIISLIDETRLKNNTLVNNYTTCKLLTKLFLFNIVRNDTYVEFIFDKIIHKGEYNDRKDFINVDKENIFKCASIYKNILELYKSSDNIRIELSDKDNMLCSLIKSRILNKLPPEIYKSILNISRFLISNNYNADILFNIDISSNQIIYDILGKLNWLGKIYNSPVSDKLYNIIIINTQAEMKDIKLKDDGLIYILDSNILLKL